MNGAGGSTTRRCQLSLHKTYNNLNLHLVQQSLVSLQILRFSKTFPSKLILESFTNLQRRNRISNSRANLIPMRITRLNNSRIPRKTPQNTAPFYDALSRYQSTEPIPTDESHKPSQDSYFYKRTKHVHEAVVPCSSDRHLSACRRKTNYPNFCSWRKKEISHWCTADGTAACVVYAFE